MALTLLARSQARKASTAAYATTNTHTLRMGARTVEFLKSGHSDNLTEVSYFTNGKRTDCSTKLTTDARIIYKSLTTTGYTK